MVSFSLQTKYCNQLFLKISDHHISFYTVHLLRCIDIIIKIYEPNLLMFISKSRQINDIDYRRSLFNVFTIFDLCKRRDFFL